MNKTCMCFKQIIIRRAQTTLDHSGNTIVPFTAPEVDVFAAPMDTEGETWNALCRLVASVDSWLRQQLQDKLVQYNEDPKGAKPTKESVEMDLLRGRAPADATGAVGYTVISRSATFPTLTRLWLAKQITVGQLMAPSINSIAENITKELASKYDRRSALRLFEDSPFWKYRHILRDESPKYKRLHARIKEMLLQPEEHMIIFALHPVSCLITMMLLLRDFPKLQVTYMHAKVPFQAKQANEGHSRQAMLEGLESRDDHQALIMTYDLGSVGLNLQEANWLTMLEEPNTHADMVQAPARVHRKGQKRATHLEALRNEINLAEKYLVRKNANRGVMDEGLDWSIYVESDAQ